MLLLVIIRTGSASYELIALRIIDLTVYMVYKLTGAFITARRDRHYARKSKKS